MLLLPVVLFLPACSPRCHHQRNHWKEHSFETISPKISQTSSPKISETSSPKISQTISPKISQAPSQTSSQTTFKVGINEILPFVFLEEQTPYGYEIELWNKIAADLDLQTEWVSYEVFGDMLQDLAAGELDAAIAGISITSEREAGGFDFSYPSYRSGLQLMVRSSQANSVQATVEGLFNWQVWRPLLLVMATSAAVGALIWAFEHRHNDHFSGHPIRGIGQGIWFAIVTLGTFGYGDVTPNKLPGRIIACLWMGASFFIVADFIASLTVGQLVQSRFSFEDLSGERVGVVDDTTAEIYGRSQPVRLVEFATFEATLAALESGEVAAILYDYPTLKYIASRNPKQYKLVGEPLTQEDYGIAFAEGHEAVEKINQEILFLQEQGYLRLLREKWFGEDAAPSLAPYDDAGSHR
ncbi:MAG: transporter substrate-binding domain-containing protein [Phormidesmis sp. RL_2_1]|nr:transporter substrate-binding domain-containing protein [Phormidesmis sp. RL_2_1]